MLKLAQQRVAVAVGSLIGALAAAPALADMAIYDPADIPGAQTLIDFESLDFGEITNPDVLITDGVRFPAAPDGEFVVFLGDNKLIDVAGTPTGNGMIALELVEPAQAAGVDYISATPLVFTAYDQSGGEIGQASVGPGSGFFGVDGEGVLIDSIVIHDSLGSFNIDNLIFSHVPAPGAVVLGAVGLGLVGWLRRRFR